MNKNILNSIVNISFLKKLAEALDGELHKEKEKRVNLSELPVECNDIKPIIIKQGVLKEVKDGENLISYCRMRMKQEHGKDPKYSLGVKNFSKNEESECEISKDTFDTFYPDNLEKQQYKKRYKIGNGWTVDDIPDGMGNDNGKIVAEFEYKDKNKIVDVPKHWKQK